MEYSRVSHWKNENAGTTVGKVVRELGAMSFDRRASARGTKKRKKWKRTADR